MLQMLMLEVLSWKRQELYSEHSKCVTQLVPGHHTTGISPVTKAR